METAYGRMESDMHAERHSETIRQLWNTGFKERLRRCSKGAKTMEKAVIVGQRSLAFTSEKKLDGFPDNLRDPGNFVLGCYL
jgi:hypothetical protein